MPQFPYKPDKSRQTQPKLTFTYPRDATNDDLNIGASGNLDGDQTKFAESEETENREPIKFKSASEAIPLPKSSRRLTSSRTKSKSSSKGNLFTDKDLIEDEESLLKFRDNFGKPIAWTILAVCIGATIYYFSRPYTEQGTENGKVHPLIVEAEMLESSNPSSVDAKREKYQKQIEVANQLIASIDDDQAIRRGSELKLKSLVGWDILNTKNNIVDNDVREMLENTSRRYVSNSNTSLANQAKIGLTLIQVKKYFLDPNKKFWPEILNQFKSVSHVARDDIVTARNLSLLADLVQSKGMTREASQLFHIIHRTCAPSDIQQIVAIGDDAQIQMESSSNLLDELKLLVDDPKNIGLALLRERIGQQLQNGSVSVGTMESILDFAEYLTEQNAIRESKAVMDDASKGIYLVSNTIERETVKQRFDDMQKRLDLYGESFLFDGLFDIGGRAISRTNLKRTAKMIVFWSPDNADSLRLIDQISENLNEFQQQDIQVIAVCNLVDNEKEVSRLESISNKYPGLTFLSLIKGNSQSLEFRSRFPIPGLPFLVMLNAVDRVAGINIQPEVLNPAVR